MKKIKISVLILVIILSNLISVNASTTPYIPHSGIYSRTFEWTEKQNTFLFFSKTINYRAVCKFSNAYDLIAVNLSGTKRWDNYLNAKGTAQKMVVGISRRTSVGSVKTTTLSTSLGLTVPVKAVEVSGKLGASQTTAKTYEITVGTDSAYTIDTRSRNGYYAVVHVFQCDNYDITVTNNNGLRSTGKMVRVNNPNGFEALHYQTTTF